VENCLSCRQDCCKNLSSQFFVATDYSTSVQSSCFIHFRVSMQVWARKTWNSWRKIPSSNLKDMVLFFFNVNYLIEYFFFRKKRIITSIFRSQEYYIHLFFTFSAWPLILTANSACAVFLVYCQIHMTVINVIYAVLPDDISIKTLND
jgi:hypothetical protein